jgi:hypothetical protein
MLGVHVAQQLSVEHWPIMCQALGSIPRIAKQQPKPQKAKKKKKKKKSRSEINSMCVHTFELMDIPHYKLKIF